LMAFILKRVFRRILLIRHSILALQNSFLFVYTLKKTLAFLSSTSVRFFTNKTVYFGCFDLKELYFYIIRILRLRSLLCYFSSLVPAKLKRVVGLNRKRRSYRLFKSIYHKTKNKKQRRLKLSYTFYRKLKKDTSIDTNNGLLNTNDYQFNRKSRNPLLKLKRISLKRKYRHKFNTKLKRKFKSGIKLKFKNTRKYKHKLRPILKRKSKVRTKFKYKAKKRVVYRRFYPKI